MAESNFLGAIFVILLAVDAYTAAAAAAAPVYSARLIHRFSGGATSWPEEKMRLLLENDLKRQRLRLGTQNQTLVAAEGGHTFNYGNDLGWLHYMWIDIGTPNNSFLVALDTGSDMFWVPCDCISCAPLSLSYYNMLDKDLAQYSSSHSNTSKIVPCSHELCERGSLCETPKGHCPYVANYLSEDTSSSGFLFEDVLHFATIGENKHQSSVHASVIIGCGSKQTGAYLEFAPNGVMGLGPGEISVPSMLAKSGVVPHSYSFCYDKSYTGRLYFGDQGPASQRSTSLLPLKEYRNVYVVEVDRCCVGSSCLKQTGFQAQVDTGSSFTSLPSNIFEQVVSEFHRQANATRLSKQIFDNCYDSRSVDISNVPSLKLVFPMNQSFLVENLVVHVIDNQGSFYCLGMYQTDGDIGIIGQNFLMGYRMVFDWEKLKLGWSISNCQDIGSNGEISHVAPPPTNASPNPLPTNQQQRGPHAHAVAPAVAERAPKASDARPLLAPYHYCITILSLFLWAACIVNYIV